MFSNGSIQVDWDLIQKETFLFKSMYVYINLAEKSFEALQKQKANLL